MNIEHKYIKSKGFHIHSNGNESMITFIYTNKKTIYIYYNISEQTYSILGQEPITFKELVNSRSFRVTLIEKEYRLFKRSDTIKKILNE